jgi:predicted RNase H-like HicB family nuclease
MALDLQIQAIIHKAEEGGYWAKVPALPGCVSQGETMEEVTRNIREAFQGCLSVSVDETPADLAGLVEITA